MNNNSYEVSILVNGKPVAEYTKNGRNFVEAKKGTEYTLRFKNNSNKRVMAVTSVDGIDVLDGKKANEADRGYIVGPYESADIKGYRINDNEVANFKFGETSLSYSVKVGGKTKSGEHEKTSKNNGVIGIRVYEEKIVVQPQPQVIIIKEKEYVPVNPWKPYFYNYPYWYYNGGGNYYSGGSTYTANYCSTNLPSNSCDNQIQASALTCYNSQSIEKPDFDIGTSWGKKIEDKVTYVEFTKSEIYTDLVIYYASREKLKEYGIEFVKTKKVPQWPQAFDDSKFCTIPEDYKG